MSKQGYYASKYRWKNPVFLMTLVCCPFCARKFLSIPALKCHHIHCHGNIELTVLTRMLDQLGSVTGGGSSGAGHVRSRYRAPVHQRKGACDTDGSGNIGTVLSDEDEPRPQRKMRISTDSLFARARNKHHVKTPGGDIPPRVEPRARTPREDIDYAGKETRRTRVDEKTPSLTELPGDSGTETRAHSSLLARIDSQTSQLEQCFQQHRRLLEDRLERYERVLREKMKTINYWEEDVRTREQRLRDRTAGGSTGSAVDSDSEPDDMIVLKSVVARTTRPKYNTTPPPSDNQPSSDQSAYLRTCLLFADMKEYLEHYKSYY